MPRDHSTRLDGVQGMDHEPENEQGVVFLFALIHRELGFSGVRRIQQGFPDCIARKRTTAGDRPVYIEFECRARRFVADRHLDQMKEQRIRHITLVCWENDWLNPPKNVHILSLKKHVGYTRIWTVATREEEAWTRFFDDQKKTHRWSLPGRSKKGDLVLIYRTRTKATPARIEDVVEIMEDPTLDQYGDPKGKIKKVLKLKYPLLLGDFRDDFILRNSSMVSGSFYQSRNNVTHLWPDIHRLILRKNPTAAKALEEFHPGKV